MKFTPSGRNGTTSSLLQYTFMLSHSLVAFKLSNSCWSNGFPPSIRVFLPGHLSLISLIGIIATVFVLFSSNNYFLFNFNLAFNTFYYTSHTSHELFQCRRINNEQNNHYKYFYPPFAYIYFHSGLNR